MPDDETLARESVDAGLAVHRALGPGMLESTYELCLAHELSLRGLTVRRQVTLPVTYRDLRIEAAYRVDLIVEDALILEVKAIQALAPVHDAQLVTYLRLSGLRLGLLMNFNVTLFRDGIRRIVR